VFKLSKQPDLDFLEKTLSALADPRVDVYQYPDYTILLIGEQICSVD